MKYSHYKEEHIRGLNILHLVKKLSDISETEINLDDLDLESFFAGEKLGGLPFWAEVSKKTEEGYLLQSLSDVCRLFSELFEEDENQENEKKPKSEKDRIRRAIGSAVLFLNLCWYKVMVPKEFYAALFTVFVCCELECELLSSEEEKIRKELTECLGYIKEYGLSEENGDNYLKDETAVLELALECRQKGIAILPPDINLSEPFEFHVEEGGIRLPFDFPFRELVWPDISRICERRKEEPFRSEREVEEFLPEYAFRRLSDNGSLASISTVLSGWPELDRELGGFQSGNLYYVAGRPGMGVTTFLKNLAVSVSRNAGSVRYYCIGAPVWDPGEAGIFVEEAGKDFLDLEKMIREEERPRLLIIDGFEYVLPFRYEAVPRKEMNRRLKLLAKDLGVPVIVTTGVTRSVEARADHHLQLRDVLCFTGSCEYVNGILGLYREGYYEPNGNDQLEVEILKSPDGKTGMVKLQLEIR